MRQRCTNAPRVERRAVPRPARTPGTTRGPFVALGGRATYPALGGLS